MGQSIVKLQNEKLPKYRIAVIDDDATVQGLIQFFVEIVLGQVEILKFADARETIFELWEASPIGARPVDLVFLDIHLENRTSGLDILEYLQYVPTSIPVVMMSSSISREQMDFISRKRVKTTFLKKPFGLSEIMGVTRWSFNATGGLYESAMQ